MLNVMFRIIFILSSLFIFGNTVSYGLYEIKQEKNTYGGVLVIVFSIFCIIFSNAVIFTICNH
mgnify:FL=1